MSSCWQCSSETGPDLLFCPACNILQPPAPGRSFFSILGLPEQYQIDLPLAEKRYKRLNLQLHPDRFVMAGAREKRFSLEHSTCINDAYRTLKDPSKRAIYMLGLWGKPITESSGRKQQLDFTFLERVMTIREAMAMAKHQGESGQALIAEKLIEVKGWYQDLNQKLETAFAKQPAPGIQPDAAVVDEIERLVHQQKYLSSILSDFNAR